MHSTHLKNISSDSVFVTGISRFILAGETVPLHELGSKYTLINTNLIELLNNQCVIIHNNKALSTAEAMLLLNEFSLVTISDNDSNSNFLGSTVTESLFGARNSFVPYSKSGTIINSTVPGNNLFVIPTIFNNTFNLESISFRKTNSSSSTYRISLATGTAGPETLIYDTDYSGCRYSGVYNHIANQSLDGLVWIMFSCTSNIRMTCISPEYIINHLGFKDCNEQVNMLSTNTFNYLNVPNINFVQNTRDNIPAIFFGGDFQ